MKQTTPKHYRLYIFIYGILSVLMVLEFFELSENYEECQKIVDAIREQKHQLGIELPTTISREVIHSLIDEYKKHNLNERDLIEHSMYYSSLILDELGY